MYNPTLLALATYIHNFCKINAIRHFTNKQKPKAIGKVYSNSTTNKNGTKWVPQMFNKYIYIVHNVTSMWNLKQSNT